DEAPALAARHRAALDDAHDVALVGVVALVVGVQRRGAAHDLLVAAMALGDVDAKSDRLVGLVRDDLALTDLRGARPALGRRGALTLGAGALGLLLLAPAAARGRLRGTDLGALLGRGAAAAA